MSAARRGRPASRRRSRRGRAASRRGARPADHSTDVLCRPAPRSAAHALAEHGKRPGAPARCARPLVCRRPASGPRCLPSGPSGPDRLATPHRRPRPPRSRPLPARPLPGPRRPVPRRRPLRSSSSSSTRSSAVPPLRKVISRPASSSGTTSTSRALEPSDGPTMLRDSIRSISRPALAKPTRSLRCSIEVDPNWVDTTSSTAARNRSRSSPMSASTSLRVAARRGDVVAVGRLELAACSARRPLGSRSR